MSKATKSKRQLIVESAISEALESFITLVVTKEFTTGELGVAVEGILVGLAGVLQFTTNLDRRGSVEFLEVAMTQAAIRIAAGPECKL